MDYYELLQISNDASLEVIKKAYHILARKYHPDKNNTSESVELFQKIQMVYEILSDVNKRLLYDTFGPIGLNTRIELLNTMNIFKKFRTLTQDSNCKINVSLSDLYTGLVKNVSIGKSIKCRSCLGHGFISSSLPICTHCSGSGSVQMLVNIIGLMAINKRSCTHCSGSGLLIPAKILCSKCNASGITRVIDTLELNIPAGTLPGHVYNFANRGGITPTSLMPGNINIIIHSENEIKTPEYIMKVLPNGDMLVTLFISLFTALTGGEFTIRHLDNHTVSFGLSYIKPDTKLILKNEGFSKKCDMVIEFNIKFPTSRDQSQPLQEWLIYEHNKDKKINPMELNNTNNSEPNSEVNSLLTIIDSKIYNEKQADNFKLTDIK